MVTNLHEFKINFVILGQRSSPRAKRDRLQTTVHRATDWKQAVRMARQEAIPRRRVFRMVSVFKRQAGETSPLGGWEVQICADRQGWILTDGQPRITAKRPPAGAGCRLVRREPAARPPANMTECSKEVFYDAVMRATVNIHCYPEKLHTDWLVVNTRQPWGWSWPGVKNTGAKPERYALVRLPRSNTP